MPVATRCFVKDKDHAQCLRPGTHRVNGVDWCCKHFESYFLHIQEKLRVMRDQFDTITGDHYLGDKKDKEILTAILMGESPDKK